MNRRVPSCAAVAAIALAASCRTAPEPAAAPPIVKPVHAHADGCGHVYENGRWREFSDEHAHGDGCGHVLVRGAWRFFPENHAHGDGCGHGNVDGAWQPFAADHVHGEGCGHDFREGMWHPFPADHRHDAECGHLLPDGAWRSPAADPGHIHAPGCGHRTLPGGGWAAAGTPSSADAGGPALPRAFSPGFFRHGGGYRTLPRGSRGEWIDRDGGAASELPCPERPLESALGGGPVAPRD